jgi:hypothetical protein
MKIFKELKKLGYIPYSATTIEELDDLPLNSAERISEQALVFRWFRDTYGLHSYIDGPFPWFRYYINSNDNRWEGFKHLKFEEAELECLRKLIEIVKQKQNEYTNNI